MICIVLSVRFVTQTAYALLLPNMFLCAINYCVIDYFELSFSQLWNAFLNVAINSTFEASCLLQRAYADVKYTY